MLCINPFHSAVTLQKSGVTFLFGQYLKQTESTYMFNLEGLIPKLCQFAREVGDHDRALKFRAAGMQTLAVLVNSLNTLCSLFITELNAYLEEMLVAVFFYLLYNDTFLEL